jgi:hypothetical protein
MHKINIIFDSGLAKPYQVTKKELDKIQSGELGDWIEVKAYNGKKAYVRTSLIVMVEID